MKVRDIIKKDMLLVLSNLKALVFILLMPIVLIVILSLSLGAVFQDESIKIDIIKVGVVDNNTSIQRLPLQILQATPYDLLNNERIKEIIDYEEVDLASGQDRLEKREYSTLIIIPEGFYSAVASNFTNETAATQIEVIGYLNTSFETNIVLSIVNAYTDQLSNIIADNKIISKYLASEKFASFSASLQEELAAHQLDLQFTATGDRKSINQFYYYSIAITCMFILYTAGQGGSFLLEESQNKTLDRLSVAGVTKSKLLLGKSTAIFALCIVQLAVLFIFSTLAFSLNWGNIFIFFAIALALSFSVTGIGTLLMIASYRTGSHNWGTMFQAIGAQLFALIGGSFIPLSVLPKFFSTAALFTPNGLAIMAFTDNVQGAPFAESAPYIVGNILIGVITLAIGLLWFKRTKGDKA